MDQFILIASETYLFSAFVTIVLLYHVGDCLKIDFMHFSKFKFYFRNLQLQKQKKPAAYGFIVNREAFVKRNVIIFFKSIKQRHRPCGGRLLSRCIGRQTYWSFLIGFVAMLSQILIHESLQTAHISRGFENV